MRGWLDTADRTLVIVAGVLIVGISLAAGFFTRGSGVGENPGFASSYSTRSEGAKAAYLLLGELGYKVERWTDSPTELPEPASAAVVVLADPILPAFSDERPAIRRFIRRGGRVLITGRMGAALLDSPSVTTAPLSEDGEKEFPSLLPGPVARNAGRISMRTWDRSGSGSGGLEYYGDEHGGTVVSFRLGKGTLVWWADSSPLTNYGLTQSSNLELFLNSIGAPKGARVLWDEYYHGQRTGLWTYVWRTPVPWFLLQAFFLAVAVVLTYSRRSGPLASPVHESRLSPIEFVETVGDLYARRGTSSGALEIAYRRFRSLLARRFGVSTETPAAKLVPRLSEIAGTAGPELGAVLAKCETAIHSSADDESEALKLIQEMHNQAQRLRLIAAGADSGE